MRAAGSKCAQIVVGGTWRAAAGSASSALGSMAQRPLAGHEGAVGEE